MKEKRKHNATKKALAMILVFCITFLSLEGNIPMDRVFAEENVLSEESVYKEENTSTEKNASEEMAEQNIEQEDVQTEIMDKATRLGMQRKGDIGDTLDGDYAYISEAGILLDDTTESGYAVRTGTAPWDENDEPGNDTGELNNIVRSFDNVTYTTYFRNKVRDDAPYSAYKTGRLHFEFVLPGSSQEVKFEEKSMSWLQAKEDVEYTIEEKEYQRKVCQVLRGSYLWVPSESNPSAIGESYQELNIVIRVLAMENGEVISPDFTFWLEGNQVPADGIVTGSNENCGEHQECEYKTISTPEIKVTTAPRYNVQLKTCEDRVQYIDSFDFTTGNEYAQNKEAGNVYGRINVIGITIQMVGKSPEHGLRGCELPDGKDIEFNLQLDAQYRNDKGDTYDVTKDNCPLLWSMDGNQKSNSQADGRLITGKYTFASGGAPFNKGTNYQSCSDGGSWIAEQSGNMVHITVQDYKIDYAQIPSADANVTQNIYYDPDTTVNYWEIQKVCFSAGECWIVQPFYDQNMNYIVDKYGAGNFTTTIEDSSLNITGKSGNALESVSDNTNQMVQNDDKTVLKMDLEKAGTIDQNIYYQKYKTIDSKTALTDGCIDNGKDWTVSGGELNITELLKHNTAEGIYTGVAYDDLIKFDDNFFDLEKVDIGSNAGLEKMSWKILYGAKADKKGWNHQDCQPGEADYDTEMKESTADNLIFFSSLDELREKGYECVAVLWEARGLASAQSTNCYIGLQGRVKNTAQAGSVYMVTHSAKAWNKKDIQEVAANYWNKAVSELTDDDYRNYALGDEFPTRENRMTVLSYENDYITSFWTNDYKTRSGLGTYLKSSYDKNGYVDGTAGILYGDSCLVVPYATKISKETVQQASGNQSAKRAYDLDSNQRIADYMLKISAVRTAGEYETEDATIKTTLYIEDTLPKGLHYISGSSFWGGTYTQKGEGKQGKIQNGLEMEPDVQINTDGTTTLKWTLENVTISEAEETYFDSIYYSCEIGTLGNQETDVENNEQLLNCAMIWGSDEQKRDFTLSNGNLAEMSIQVSKNNAISLSKIADQEFVEVGESVGDILNIGNNGVNPMEIIAVDSLPYDGDEVESAFSGACKVTELQVLTPELLDGFTLYYTTDKTQRGKTSKDYTKEEIQNSTNWEKLGVNNLTGNVEIPDEFEPIAIAAIGTLPEQKTLKMHITMCFPDGMSGDYIVNRLTRDDLESDARTYLVSRNLEGNVWMDSNKNGIYENNEEKINGVLVTLMKLKDGGNPKNQEDYQPYQMDDGTIAMVETGKQYNVSTGKTEDYADGKYKFSNLPAGTVAVRFEDGSFSLYLYEGTLRDQGDDDTVDSDAVPEYEEKEGVRTLKKGFISDIVMPTKEEMTSAIYNSKYHDFGIYPTDMVPDTGRKYHVPGNVLVMIIGAAGIVGIYRYRLKRRRGHYK